MSHVTRDTTLPASSPCSEPNLHASSSHTPPHPRMRRGAPAASQPDAVSCLVVGTESGRVLILNAAGTAIVKNIWVGVTPSMLAIQVCARRTPHKAHHTPHKACTCLRMWLRISRSSHICLGCLP